MNRSVLLVRSALFALAIPEGVGGLWGVFVPRSWNKDFPLPGRGLVGELGAYNEHLAVDAAAGLLALAVLAVFAGIFLERRFVIATMVAWMVFGLVHLSVHLRVRGTLDDVEATLNLLVVGATVIGPAVVVFLARKLPTPGR